VTSRCLFEIRSNTIENGRFQEEFLLLLRKREVEFDERYLWQ
jgi:hypothetical protein